MQDLRRNRKITLHLHLPAIQIAMKKILIKNQPSQAGLEVGSLQKSETKNRPYLNLIRRMRDILKNLLNALLKKSMIIRLPRKKL
jgi:hypothetical protein